MKDMIKTATQSAEISRYYVRAYTAAMEETKLDWRLFGDLEEQRAYFRKQLAAAKRGLRDSLFAGRALLAREIARASDDDKEAMEVAIDGIDAELEGLKEHASR